MSIHDLSDLTTPVRCESLVDELLTEEGVGVVRWDQRGVCCRVVHDAELRSRFIDKDVAGLDERALRDTSSHGQARRRAHVGCGAAGHLIRTERSVDARGRDLTSIQSGLIKRLKVNHF